jgi:uncharacterized membrane protein
VGGRRPRLRRPRPSSLTGVAGPLDGRAGAVLVVAALTSLVAGLLAGLLGGPLWLDEAISVNIATLPPADAYEALRRDGAPPLYYVLLGVWTKVFGTGTVVVRLVTLLLVPVALWLACRLGGRLGGRSGGRAAVVVLAALPWTMRYGSETRMYLLVVVLALAGALALLRVRSGPSRPAVLGLAACALALLLTHYWSLFLLAAVGLVHLPGLLRRSASDGRVVMAMLLAGVGFLPWLPTFLFQATNTGTPWAAPPGLTSLLRTPQYWGGGPLSGRVWLALLLVPLAGWAAWRGPRPVRPVLGVAVLTLVLAWAATAVAGGAYTGRYTAVVVPLVAVGVGLGAVALPGRRAPVLALALVVLVGAVTGVRAAAKPRSSAVGIADAFTAAATPGDVLVFCPDQLAPPVARVLGEGYELVVYPTLGPPELVDWVGYAARNEAASPSLVAAQLDRRAGSRQLFVLKASGYRTFGAGRGREWEPGDQDDCDDLLAAVEQLRGPGQHLFGNRGTTAQQLFRFDGG